MSKSVAKKSAAKSLKSAARKAAKVSKAAPVAETVAPVATKATKSAPVAKAAEKAPTAKAPNPVIAACIELMLRPEGAGITDFQTVEGFAIPSMAVVRAAQRAGYEASASKVPGARTVYKAIPKS